MEPQLSELRSFITAEYKRRKEFKPSYSKRAFSRDLGVSVTSLNDFILGKRGLALKNVDKIFKYLKKKQVVACSWCETPTQKTSLLIGGPRSQFICRACVETCNEIIRTRKMRR